MNIKSIIIGIILIVLGTTHIQAQDYGKEIIDDFFTNFENFGADVAVTELYKTNPWTTRIQDAINNVKTQLAQYDENLVGEYYGHELIVTKKLGESFVLHSYFLKFDRQFLRLTFQFYKPLNEWRLYSFQFDDSYADEIEEAARLYYMDLD